MADWTGDQLLASTIQVEGIAKDTTHDTLWLLFENESRTGGGDVRRVNMLYQWNMAWVTFEDPTVAARVLERNQINHKDELSVSEVTTLLARSNGSTEQGAEIVDHFHNEAGKQKTNLLSIYPDSNGTVYLRFDDPMAAKILLQRPHINENVDIILTSPNDARAHPLQSNAGLSQLVKTESPIEDYRSESHGNNSRMQITSCKTEQENHYTTSGSGYLQKEETHNINALIRDNHEELSPGETNMQAAFVLGQEPFADTRVEVNRQFLPKRTVDLDRLRHNLLVQRCVKLTTDRDGKHHLAGPWKQIIDVKNMLCIKMQNRNKCGDSHYPPKLPTPPKLARQRKPVAHTYSIPDNGKRFMKGLDNHSTETDVDHNQIIREVSGSHPNQPVIKNQGKGNGNGQVLAKKLIRNDLKVGSKDDTLPNKPVLPNQTRIRSDEPCKPVSNADEHELQKYGRMTDRPPVVNSGEEKEGQSQGACGINSQNKYHTNDGKYDSHNNDHRHTEILDINVIGWEMIKLHQQSQLDQIMQECDVQIAGSHDSPGRFCITGRRPDVRLAKSMVKKLEDDIGSHLNMETVNTEQVELPGDEIKANVKALQNTLGNKVLVHFIPQVCRVDIYGFDEHACSDAKNMLLAALGFDEKKGEVTLETGNGMGIGHSSSSAARRNSAETNTVEHGGSNIKGSIDTQTRTNADGGVVTAKRAFPAKGDTEGQKTANMPGQSNGNVDHTVPSADKLVSVPGNRTTIIKGDKYGPLTGHKGVQSQVCAEATVEVNENIRTDSGLPLTEAGMSSRRCDIETLYACDMLKGILVQVCRGDITKIQSDIIASAADEGLQLTGGVAKAIALAAGPELVDQCKQHIKVNGPLEVAEVIATTGGKLKCRAVVHAVGPRWSDYAVKEKCAQDLYSSIFGCLTLANDNKARTIAIPAIGSGTSGVPKCVVAKAIYDATAQFDSTTGSTRSLKGITFVTIDDEVNEEIVNAFQNRGKVDTTTFMQELATSAASEGGASAGAYPNQQWRHWLQNNRETNSRSSQYLQPDKPGKSSPCLICNKTILKSKTLENCLHTFCVECIETWFKANGPKCPKCGKVYEMLKGNQPITAKMSSFLDEHFHLPGYDDNTSTFIINYDIPAGLQTEEHPNPGRLYQGATFMAYLPANKEGQELLKLLEKAFDARLIFTIKPAMSTSGDVIMWADIPHKTRTSGGPKRFGYPDGNYLSNLRTALASKGIN